MRAAIYARVSTEDQAKEGFSIAAQQKKLIAYCKARGWQVAGEYIDEGYSGRSTNRPSYQRMMSEKDLWDVLVVLKMDRIHRNSTNFALMMDDLRHWGKEFNSMQESFDTTTAIGRFVMDIIQRIAQLESEQIGERVKVGMVQKAKKGKGVLGSGVPYGYRFHNHHLEKVQEEEQVVKDIFSMYLDCLSLNDIASSLNAKGIPTKQSSKWEKATVRNVLTNKLYIGMLEWDGIAQRMPEIAIVDNDRFWEVQALLAHRRRKHHVLKNKAERGVEINA
ncbi:MAG: recombinase family protein [Methanomassiliicoccales archaeon]|nr:MAG: recombinase family protein [Methanomassiliicoccales archaeon]